MAFLSFISLGLSKIADGKTIELAASQTIYELTDKTWLSKNIKFQGI